jgi:hypothetical protein
MLNELFHEVVRVILRQDDAQLDGIRASRTAARSSITSLFTFAATIPSRAADPRRLQQGRSCATPCPASSTTACGSAARSAASTRASRRCSTSPTPRGPRGVPRGVARSSTGSSATASRACLDADDVPELDRRSSCSASCRRRRSSTSRAESAATQQHEARPEQGHLDVGEASQAGAERPDHRGELRLVERRELVRHPER